MSIRFLGVDSSTQVQVQKSGWVGLIQMHKQSILDDNLWRKVWLVVKDGFLCGYRDHPGCESFPLDVTPMFVIPLGTAVITVDKKDKKVIHVDHPDIPKSKLQFKGADSVESTEWLALLESARKCTWENALLGNALIEKLNNQDRALTKQRAEYLQQQQEMAQKIDAERERKEQILAKVESRGQEMEKKVSMAQLHAKELAEKKKNIAVNLNATAKARVKNAKRRELMEKALGQARFALAEMETILEGYDSSRKKPVATGATQNKRDSSKRASFVSASSSKRSSIISEVARVFSKSRGESESSEGEVINVSVKALKDYFEEVHSRRLLSKTKEM